VPGAPVLDCKSLYDEDDFDERDLDGLEDEEDFDEELDEDDEEEGLEELDIDDDGHVTLGKKRRREEDFEFEE
jgi:hypothetical protein